MELRRLRALIDIDPPGREQDVAAFIARTLREFGWHVDEQLLTDGRFNVIARAREAGSDGPRVVLSTHFDCVPPFVPSGVEGGRLFGRGACDAKGILAAQVAAAERARNAGRTDVGLLFVAGEERGSDGAKAANTWPIASKYLINGEPTDNRLGLATRGVPRQADSHGPRHPASRLGESAIEGLMDALVALREVEWPADELLAPNYRSA
jgi:acetylornithine deacetylase